MKVIPAIDLINGECVRLYQGDYERKTFYPGDAVSLAKKYQQQGAQSLHLVDLDGAKQKRLVQQPLISKIIENLSIPVQIGGGIRTSADVETCLAMGVDKIVIGSLAVTNKDQCEALLKQFGSDRFIIALDVSLVDNIPIVVSHAWSIKTGFMLWDIAREYEVLGVDTILCTDIACDGTLKGPNLSLYEQALSRFPTIHWQASGGVRNKNDLVALAECGVSAAIVGKALYQTDVDLPLSAGEKIC
jgi:phosphoribosylformimino-5-aminoimidazole carboxamide ribotide isomerase